MTLLFVGSCQYPHVSETVGNYVGKGLVIFAKATTFIIKTIYNAVACPFNSFMTGLQKQTNPLFEQNPDGPGLKHTEGAVLGMTMLMVTILGGILSIYKLLF